jgi:hypothetical protein
MWGGDFNYADFAMPAFEMPMWDENLFGGSGGYDLGGGYSWTGDYE